MAQLRIKDILAEKGLTAKSLAERMGKSPQYISNIINGGKGASVNTLQEIAEALQVPVSSLFADFAPATTSQTFVCPKCGTKLIININAEGK